ncbi:MAG: glycosyltransferase family 2 protein [Lachnospiraceae bacterium]|nr:glycosyltransferase family 2 protein [Candidatus Equihabitans merdae]
MNRPTTLYTVIPCYNEEEVLGETSKRMQQKYADLYDKGMITQNSKVLFVNDGSKDGTWDIICSLSQQNTCFAGINLSRNRGHQNALLAGILTAKQAADVVISMDADLQDDINAIDEMLEKYFDGCDVVYGVRSKRESDTFFKRTTAQGYYKFMHRMGAEVVYNHADYRLMSRRALEGLAQFKEVNLFLRGMVPLVGYKSDVVYYERGERFAGQSKYPLKKMLSFAADGITSLSTDPIRWVLKLGAGIFVLSLIMLIYSVVRWATGHTTSGWASLMCSIWVIGGLTLISIGVIGEYIGKIYMETKERPRYIIESCVGLEERR